MDRATRERRTPRRMFSIRSMTGLVAGALALSLVLVPAASAVPQDPNSTPVSQDCEGSTGVRIFLHPGAGKALWEVTAEATPDPNYLIKVLEHDEYVNGQYIGHFTYSFGNKTGLGDTFRCTFYETFTDPDGNFIEVFGTSYKVAV
ncbi:MAG TPA: hypothetical protein VGK11_05215 [Actinomycetota bacterium]|jgi:hypothetical protein